MLEKREEELKSSPLTVDGTYVTAMELHGITDYRESET
jgi:hypothetical protein